MAVTTERLRALRLIPRCPDGCTEAILLAHGFSIGMLAELVFDRFAATKVEKTRAGGKTMNVVRLRPLYRSMRRARKTRARLGGSADVFEPIPAKPKGMHTSTYWRLLQQAQRADAALAVATEKRFGPF